MNYYERHIGDYLKDTSHLSLLEHGVYTRLLDVYYTREGGIPDAEAARLIQARSKEERAALQTVLSEFFVLSDGLHVQDRSEREIARYREKSEKASRSANARWKKAEPHCEGIADAMRTHSDEDANALPTQSEGNAPSNQTPVTKEKKKRRASALTPLPEGFGVSPRVESWAAEHGFANLDRHLEHFVSYAKRKAATYADWDEAFMNAIRKNWADVPTTVVPIRRLAF